MQSVWKRRVRTPAYLLTLAGFLAVLTQVPGDLLVSVGSLVTVFCALLMLVSAAGAASSELERGFVRKGSRFAQFLPALLLAAAAALCGGTVAMVTVRDHLPGDIHAASFVLMCLMWAATCRLMRLTAQHTNGLGWWPLTSPRLFANLDGTARILVAAAVGWVPASTGAGVGADAVAQIAVPLVILLLWTRQPKAWKPLIELDLETAVASAQRAGVTDLSISSAGVGNHELDPRVLEWRRNTDARVAALLERCGYTSLAARATRQARKARTSKVTRVARGLMWVLVSVYLTAALIGITIALTIDADLSRKILWGGLLCCLIGLILRLWTGPAPFVRPSETVAAKIQAVAERDVEA